MFRVPVKSTLSTCIVGMIILFCSASLLRGVANGSVSGTFRDPSGAVIPDAQVALEHLTSMGPISAASPRLIQVAAKFTF